MEAKQAATAILMLESAEEDVVANACDALYKFAEKCLYFFAVLCVLIHDA